MDELDAYAIATDIYNVFRTHKINIQSDNPYERLNAIDLARCVIEYDTDIEGRVSREDCTWQCRNFDESSGKEWWDGYICPGCGYIRGMNKK